MNRQPTVFRDIITGSLHSRLIETMLAPQLAIKSYKQEMRLDVGDWVTLYGRPPHQRQIYTGVIASFNGTRMNLADETGRVFASCCAEGAVCVVKY